MEYRSTDNTKQEKKEETLAEKITRTLIERHIKTHGSLTDMFRQLQIYFLIGEHTVKMVPKYNNYMKLKV